MNKSESIDQLAVALNKAQGSMKMAEKGNVNPFFKSNYTDLATAIETSRPALIANGLSIVQMPGVVKDDGTIELETYLMHISGQYIGSTMTLKAVKQDPQGYGSAITYARRYAYMAIICLASEDDDGNAASKPVNAVLPELTPKDEKTWKRAVEYYTLHRNFTGIEAKLSISEANKKLLIKEAGV